MPADVKEILKIRVSPRHGEDILAWWPDKMGVFSVKSAYHFAFDEIHRSNTVSSSSSPTGARSCWKFIWRVWCSANSGKFCMEGCDEFFGHT